MQQVPNFYTPSYQGELVTASTSRIWWKWSFVIPRLGHKKWHLQKGGFCPLTQTFALKSPETPCRKSNYLKFTMMWELSHKDRPCSGASVSSTGLQVIPAQAPDIRCTDTLSILFPVQIPDPRSPQSNGCFILLSVSHLIDCKDNHDWQ